MLFRVFGSIAFALTALTFIVAPVPALLMGIAYGGAALFLALGK